MTDAQRQKRIEKAQLRVLFNVPFFAPGVAKLPVVFDSSIDTACTAGDSIRWNPDWFDTLEDKVLPTILCHEAAHCLLGHLWRAPDGADWDKWNQATDHAVNLMLAEFAETVKAGNVADPFPFPDGQWCKNSAFAGMNEEKIYAILASQKGIGGAGGGGGANRGSKAQSGRGGQGANGAGQNSSKPGANGAIGQIAKPAGGAKSTQGKQSQAEWVSTLMQSVAAAKGRGNLPGSLERFVENLKSPVVPWQELLRSFLREQAADDWNFMRPNRYFDGADFMLPTLDNERMAGVVFAVDTSGSVDQTLLTQFKGEIQNCLDDLKPDRLVEICCDARITQEREYRVGDTIDIKAPGGGGTSFRPVFDRCEQLNPKCVVYLTDLEGDFPPEAPNYPVIWVAWGGRSEAPFGEVVPVRDA